MCQFCCYILVPNFIIQNFTELNKILAVSHQPAISSRTDGPLNQVSLLRTYSFKVRKTLGETPENCKHKVSNRRIFYSLAFEIQPISFVMGGCSKFILSSLGTWCLCFSGQTVWEDGWFIEVIIQRKNYKMWCLILKCNY